MEEELDLSFNTDVSQSGNVFIDSIYYSFGNSGVTGMENEEFIPLNLVIDLGYQASDGSVSYESFSWQDYTALSIPIYIGDEALLGVDNSAVSDAIGTVTNEMPPVELVHNIAGAIDEVLREYYDENF